MFSKSTKAVLLIGVSLKRHEPIRYDRNVNCSAVFAVASWVFPLSQNSLALFCQL